MRRTLQFGGNVVSGAVQEGFSQVMLGRDAPMTGAPTVGGAIGSMAVKYMVGEAKEAMKPNFSGFSGYDRAAVAKSPVMMSNRGRQQLQGQGLLNSRDVGLQQRQAEMFKSAKPEAYKQADAELRNMAGGGIKERD